MRTIVIGLTQRDDRQSRLSNVKHHSTSRKSGILYRKHILNTVEFSDIAQCKHAERTAS